jgi:hypothetical protein
MFREINVSVSLEAHLKMSPPDKLYHYTSPEALLAIVTHKELWCTDALFLNDSSELLHTIKIAKAIIQEKIEGGSNTQYSEGVIALLKEILVEIDIVTQQATYIASFTRLPDDLSQWRAYCPPSGGYAIGFPVIQLVDMINKSSKGLMNSIFAECIYDLGIQRSILGDIIDEIANQFVAHFGQNMYINVKDGGPFLMLPFKNEAITYIHKIAPLMKDYSFRDEKEWRFVGTVRSDYWVGRDILLDEKLGFRASSKGIVPFFKLKIADEESPYLGKRGNVSFSVRIGPAPDMVNRQNAVSRFLRFHLSNKQEPNKQESDTINYPKDFKAELSDIPYKNW